MELVLMIKNMEKENINITPLFVMIIGILLGMILISCGGQNTQQVEEPIGLRQKSDDRHKNVTEFTYGGCEYIRVGYGQSAWGSHKGNCVNPIHKNGR